MSQWTIITPAGEASVVMTADKMAITDLGQLVFFKDAEVHAAFNDIGWLSVSHTPEPVSA